MDADGKERGFGFVRFADSATQQAAITGLDKTVVGGRTLNVRAVEERAMPASKITASKRCAAAARADAGGSERTAGSLCWIASGSGGWTCV